MASSDSFVIYLLPEHGILLPDSALLASAEIFPVEDVLLPLGSAVEPYRS